ncbi:hypothetical protein R6Q57_015075 [Mikania cordata]
MLSVELEPSWRIILTGTIVNGSMTLGQERAVSGVQVEVQNARSLEQSIDVLEGPEMQNTR